MKDIITEYNQESLLADGFDDAIIGIVDSFSDNPVVLYDKDKCIDILCKDMSREEAIEYFNFNVMGAYMGDNTPKFAMLFNK
jgi:hypothetical protein